MFQRHVLGSGSADQTVKVWDLAKSKCVNTYKNHSAKISKVEWNPKEEPILVTAGSGEDNTIHTFDVRTPTSIVSDINTYSAFVMLVRSELR